MVDGCQGTNAHGAPCESPEYGEGYCFAHSPGGPQFMKAIASKGGKATAAKLAGRAYTAEELTRIETLEDAKVRLDLIQVGVLTRRISHAEANAASKCISEWVKAEGVAATGRLVGELRAELDARVAEIADLRKKMMKVSR